MYVDRSAPDVGDGGGRGARRTPMHPARAVYRPTDRDLEAPMPNYGDWQFSIYLDGLTGIRPELPMAYADLERIAERTMTEQLWSYVSGGAGNERTQRANVEAFQRWGL